MLYQSYSKAERLVQTKMMRADLFLERCETMETMESASLLSSRSLSCLGRGRSQSPCVTPEAACSRGELSTSGAPETQNVSCLCHAGIWHREL